MWLPCAHVQNAAEAPHYDQGGRYGSQCHQDQATTLLHQGECRHTSPSSRGHTQGLRQMNIRTSLSLSLFLSVSACLYLSIFIQYCYTLIFKFFFFFFCCVRIKSHISFVFVSLWLLPDPSVSVAAVHSPWPGKETTLIFLYVNIRRPSIRFLYLHLFSSHLMGKICELVLPFLLAGWILRVL